MGNHFLNGNKRADNELLHELPQSEWDRLRPSLQPVLLDARSVLYSRHQPLDYVYFLQQGCVSLMIDFADGFQAETCQIGKEGMVGVPLVHGIKREAATATVQVAGTALCLSADAFTRAMAECPVLQGRLLRYAEALRAQTMQLAACNGHHGLDARLARCLLGLQDRLGADGLPVTHEMLAGLLCAHRPSVSVSAKRLQQSGLIRYASGSLLVANRAGLEQVACECYGIIRDAMTPSRRQPKLESF